MLLKRNYVWGMIALTVLVFSPALIAKFVFFDDDLHIFRNSILALPFTESLRAIWLDSYRGFYIPVTYTAWALLTQITHLLLPFKSLEEMPAVVFHVFNLLLHLGNILFLIDILKRTVSNQKAVLFGVFLFAVHPVQVESVAWATGLKDLLSTFLALSAIWVVLRLHSKNWLLSGLFSTLLFLGALFSKPSTVVLPLLAIPFFYFIKKEDFRRTLPLFLFWTFLVVPFGLITRRLQPASLLLDYTPFYLRPLVALDAVAFYLRKLLFPVGLTIDYSRTPQFVFKNVGSYFSILVLMGSSVFLWRKRYWFAISFLALFTIALSPVLGFVPFSFQNFSTVADHYLYLPMVVVSLFAAVSMDWGLLSRRVPRYDYPVLIFGSILVGISFWQCTYWANTIRLMRHSLAVNPKSTLAHNNLAVEYETRGDLEKSLYHYRQASSFNPRLNHHHYNIGNILLKQGDIQKAEQAFHETLRVDPKYAEAYFSLGLIEEAARNYPRAIELFQTALEMDPTLGKAAIKIGTTWVKQGNVDRGIRQIAQSIQLDPKVSAQGFYHLGRAYLAKNDFTKAREAFEQSVMINPKYEPAISELELLK